MKGRSPEHILAGHSQNLMESPVLLEKTLCQPQPARYPLMPSQDHQHHIPHCGLTHSLHQPQLLLAQPLTAPSAGVAGAEVPPPAIFSTRLFFREAAESRIRPPGRQRVGGFCSEQSLSPMS